MKINSNDFKIETLKGNKKAGGQNQNKRETAVRITHIPTGIVEWCQDERYQERNKSIALERITQRLEDAYERARVRTLSELFPINNEIIKTYNWNRGTVKDHRTGEIKALKDVLEGKID